jgi:hypothetical protein
VLATIALVAEPVGVEVVTVVPGEGNRRNLCQPVPALQQLHQAGPLTGAELASSSSLAPRMRGMGWLRTCQAGQLLTQRCLLRHIRTM